MSPLWSSFVGDVKETTPFYHRPWLEHLAREGYEVIYPGYETYPGEPQAVKHLVQGVAASARPGSARGASRRRRA